MTDDTSALEAIIEAHRVTISEMHEKLKATQETLMELEFIRDQQQSCGWKPGHPPPPCVVELRKRTPVAERTKIMAEQGLRQALQSEVVSLLSQLDNGIPDDVTGGDVPRDGKRYRVWRYSSVVRWEAGPNRYVEAGDPDDPEVDADSAAWNNDGWRLEPDE